MAAQITWEGLGRSPEEKIRWNFLYGGLKVKPVFPTIVRSFFSRGKDSESSAMENENANWSEGYGCVGGYIYETVCEAIFCCKSLAEIGAAVIVFSTAHAQGFSVGLSFRRLKDLSAGNKPQKLLITLLPKELLLETWFHITFVGPYSVKLARQGNYQWEGPGTQ